MKTKKIWYGLRNLLPYPRVVRLTFHAPLLQWVVLNKDKVHWTLWNCELSESNVQGVPNKFKGSTNQPAQLTLENMWEISTNLGYI